MAESKNPYRQRMKRWIRGGSRFQCGGDEMTEICKLTGSLTAAGVVLDLYVVCLCDWLVEAVTSAMARPPGVIEIGFVQNGARE